MKTNLAHDVPYPVLGPSSHAYPKGRYLVDTAMRMDGNALEVAHKITDAPFIENLIDEGLVQFSCHLAIPKAGVRRLIDTGKEGTIELDSSLFGELPELCPSLIYTGPDREHQFTSTCGVADIWHGKKIRLPRGARLARGSDLNIPPSEHHLIRFRADPSYDPGTFTVRENTEDGFHFVVTAATDIHRFVKNPGNNQAMRGAVLTNIISQCFSILKHEYSEDEESALGIEAFSNLKSLRDKIQEEIGFDWSAKKFDPLLAATTMYPVRVRPVIYKELDHEDCSELNKDLTRVKGSIFQREFLAALKDTEKFIRWLESRVRINDDGAKFDSFSNSITENEFREMPIQVEKELFSSWSKITPAQACRPSFWGYVTLQHLKNGAIDAHFLAANRVNLPDGLERIDAALKSGEEKRVDDTVRTALRQLSGLLEVRGNRTVYANCPFARAWWRCHIAKKVCAETGADSQKVMEVLRTNQSYWERLVSSVVSKKSVFSDEHIRSALIWALSDKINGGKNTHLFQGKTLDKIIKRIGVRLAWQELAIFETDELKALFENEFLA